jgi:TPR repeat protein
LSKTLRLSLLRSSADLGHADAQYWYGDCLLSGKDCDGDAAAAVRYLKQSADSHNSHAECLYGRCVRMERWEGWTKRRSFHSADRWMDRADTHSKLTACPGNIGIPSISKKYIFLLI